MNAPVAKRQCMLAEAAAATGTIRSQTYPSKLFSRLYPRLIVCVQSDIEVIQASYQWS